MFTIYSIKCKSTGKEYIGKTSNLDARIKQHVKYSKMKESDRSHYPLYIDMKKNGFDSFVVEAIFVIDCPVEASLMEKKYIKEREPFYNTIDGGGGTLSVDEDRIVRLFEEFGNSKEVAKITGYDYKTVRICLDKHGVERNLNLGSELARKQIQSYDLDSGETIQTYDSVASASVDMSGKVTGKSAINKVATGRAKSYHGRGWRYV